VDEPTPAALRAAVALIATEAVAVAVVAAAFAYEAVTDDATTVAGGVAVTLFVAGFGLTLGGLARALHHRRGGVRGIAVVLQLLLLPIGWYAARGGQPWYGIPVMAVAVAVCGLLLTPAATRALGLAERGR
jgi:hypothetical protein